jgi:predicted nucleic acid-binding protein
VIILDTSGLLAAIDGSQHHHAASVAALEAARPPLLLSPFVLAELDYLLVKHVGPRAQEALLDEVARQAYQLEPFDSEDVAEARRVMDRYGDLSMGLADASLVVLAVRYGVADLLTLDERHFRAIQGPRGEPFRLLPADAA